MLRVVHRSVDWLELWTHFSICDAYFNMLTHFSICDAFSTTQTDRSFVEIFVRKFEETFREELVRKLCVDRVAADGRDRDDVVRHQVADDQDVRIPASGGQKR